MTSIRSTLSAAVLLAAVALPNTAHAAELTPAEKLYAELFKLPPAEREARILEGAKKEAALGVHPNYRGRQGKIHTDFFQNRHSFLKLTVSDLNSYEGLERVIAETATGRHETDASGFSLPDYAVIKDRNILAHYPTPATERILPKFRGFLTPDNYWIVQSISEHGISYNTELVKLADAPKGWMDLCHPRFKGQVSFDPGETKFLIGIYTMFGKDMEKFRQWMECIGNNDPIVVRGHPVRTTLMIAGDHAVQGDNFFYDFLALKLKNPKKVPIQEVYEAPITIFAGAVYINKNTPRPYAAALYTDWILSDESQQFLVSEFRGPVTLPHPFLKDDAQLVVFSYETKEISDQLLGYWNKYVAKRG